MKPPVPDSEARKWAAAWRAFADDDAAASAPSGLEWRVLQAGRTVHAARPPAIGPVRRHWPLAAVATAASLMLVAGFLGRLPGNWTSTTRDTSQPALPRVEPRVPLPPAGAAAADRAFESTITAATPPSASEPPAADRAADTETVQLVRIRVPVGALLALGVTTIDPDASGVVDVDVTVGDDGLAREIRGIRAVPHAGRE